MWASVCHLLFPCFVRSAGLRHLQESLAGLLCAPGRREWRGLEAVESWELLLGPGPAWAPVSPLCSCTWYQGHWEKQLCQLTWQDIGGQFQGPVSASSAPGGTVTLLPWLPPPPWGLGLPCLLMCRAASRWQQQPAQRVAWLSLRAQSSGVAPQSGLAKCLPASLPGQAPQACGFPGVRRVC